MKIVNLIKLNCFIILGIIFLIDPSYSTFRRNGFRNYQNKNEDYINGANNNNFIQNQENLENTSEEEEISNLEYYIKRLKNDIISKRPSYSKIYLPNIGNDKNDTTIYVENFNENDLVNSFHHSKSKINSLINENLEETKLRYFPVESKNLELNSNLKLIENQLNLKRQDLDKQQEQISQISLSKEKELAETNAKTNFYKENTDKILSKTMKIFNNINQIKNITDDYSNKYESYKEDGEKMFERVKEFSRKDLKSLEIKEELILYLKDLQKALNSTGNALNESNKGNNTIKKTKSDKLLKELNLKNILKKNYTEELIDLVVNTNLEDNKSLLSLIEKLDSVSIKPISSLKENTDSSKLIDIRSFFDNSKKNVNNRTAELINTNKRLKKELEKAKKKTSDDNAELAEVKKNNEGLQKVRMSYNKLLQEERDRSTFLTNKISILNSELKKKMLRLKEVSKIEPKIQSIENKFRENLKETKKEIEDSSIDKLINNINEIVNQENLIFKTNKLKSIR